MISVNEVTIVGNLTRDPELKALPTGSSVVNLSIATNRSWKDQAGQKQEQVEYHNIIAFAKMADTIAQYFKKGQQIYLKGRLQTRSWDDTESGKKMYRTEIVMSDFQFGHDPNRAPSQGGSDTGSGYGYGTQPARPQRATSDAFAGISYGDDDVNPDDIPF